MVFARQRERMPHYKQIACDRALNTAGGSPGACFSPDMVASLLRPIDLPPLIENEEQRTRSDYASAPSTIYHHRVVVTDRQALNTALIIKWIQDNEWMGLLGVHDARAPNVVCDPATQAVRAGINNTVLDDKSYTADIAALVSDNIDADSWSEVNTIGLPLRYGCVCGRAFDSDFARDLHLRSAPVRTRHDIAPEARPRLSAAWVLLDADEPNVFRAVISAGAKRMPSRSRSMESSTSSEERAILLALREEADHIPPGCALLLSTDSDGARQAIEQCCQRHKLARRLVRTPEAGTLQAIDEVFDEMHTRHIDVTAAWEPACHDRKKRGTTDGACRVLARLNHACDRLADLAAAAGRSHDMDFYQTWISTRPLVKYN